MPRDEADEDVYEGGCHCGAVRFRVRVREHEAVECNCSICSMKGLLHHFAEPEDFEAVAGTDELTTYTFGTHTAQHTFCRTCGVQPFYRARSHPNHVDVNIRCLDDDEALSRFRIRAFDGRNWEESIQRIR